MQTTGLRQQVFRPASSAAPARRATPSITCAAAPEQQRREVPGLKQLAVGLAAAVLVHSAPANAGVVIQKSQLKKVFQSDPVERVKKVAQEAVQKAPGNDAGPSLPKVNLPSGGGINLSLLTLPLAIGGIAVGALAWKQIDPGFDSFFDDALAKNSNKDGAGYEQQLVKSGQNMKGMAKKAVKETAKTAKTGTKKVGGFFGLKK